MWAAFHNYSHDNLVEFGLVRRLRVACSKQSQCQQNLISGSVLRATEPDVLWNVADQYVKYFSLQRFRGLVFTA